MAFRRFLALLSLAGLFPMPAGAQPAADVPVFRSGVDLVRLDVRVTDEQGRPIRDLGRDEVEIVEDGEVRPILLFQHIAAPEGTYVEVAQRTVGGEVSTNRGAPRGHLYVLVFDQHHLTPGNEQRARLAAERFLNTRIAPGDRVALYGLPGPGPQVPFTAEIRRVAGELVQVRGSLERVGIGALGTMSLHEAYEIKRGNQNILARVANRLAQEAGGTDVLRALGRAVSAAGGGTENPAIFTRLVQEDARTIVTRADEEARRFLVMLADVMRELIGIDGRKTIILVSEGFYTDGVTRELEQAAAAAAESYSVIYALDLNRRADLAAASEPTGGEHQTEIQSRLEPLGSLAVETDGALVNDATSQIDRVLDRIADASQDYYIVGFAPAARASRQRSAYHRVKVVVRRKGARASTRTGYSLVGADATPADRRRAIDRALRAPFPQQGLAIEYTTYVLRGASAAAQRVVLSLAVELPIASAARTGAADLVFVVRRAGDGHVVASGTDAIPLPDSARPGSTTGLGTFRVQFEAPAGTYLMRVVVREPGGLVGSADRRFEVRPLATRDVTASDLILGSASDALPVRPIALVGQMLEGAVELYARTPDELHDVDVVVELLPIGGTAALTSVRADLLDVRDTGTGATRAARIGLPLEGTPPGEYVARATVRARGETVGQVAREMQILPGLPPAERPTAPAWPVLEPTEVLRGELARRYLSALRESAPTPALAKAADLALHGAWPAVESALGREDGDPAPMYFGLRGLARFAASSFTVAAADLKKAAGDPPSALAAFFLGWAYEADGQHREAIGAWRSAAYADPTLVPAHLALADAYLKVSQPALAIQALRAGLVVLPASPELRDKLASIQRYNPE